MVSKMSFTLLVDTKTIPIFVVVRDCSLIKISSGKKKNIKNVVHYTF